IRIQNFQAHSSFFSYYDIFFFKALLPKENGGLGLTFGQAHLYADKCSKEITSTDAEAIIIKPTGEILKTSTIYRILPPCKMS
ncbi:MAG: hypothetical protein AABZ14_02795, partial [Candidatus Margulisiibacteriota bacterium]